MASKIRAFGHHSWQAFIALFSFASLSTAGILDCVSIGFFCLVGAPYCARDVCDWCGWKPNVVQWSNLSTGYFVIGMVTLVASRALRRFQNDLKDDQSGQETTVQFPKNSAIGTRVGGSPLPTSDGELPVFTAPAQSLEGCAAVLASQLKRTWKGKPDGRGKPRKPSEPKIRVWIYLVADRSRLQRATRIYGGTDDEQSTEQHLSIRCGVAGKAARTGKCWASKVSPKHTLPQELTENWSYSIADAKAVRQDRESAFAVPVEWMGSVHAVIIADSCEADFFGDDRSVARRLMVDAAFGVAEIILRDYTPAPNANPAAVSAGASN